MVQIPDDPIIECMERTGYPPWIPEDDDPYGEGGDDEDVFFGSETETF